MTITPLVPLIMYYHVYKQFEGTCSRKHWYKIGTYRRLMTAELLSNLRTKQSVGNLIVSYPENEGEP